MGPKIKQPQYANQIICPKCKGVTKPSRHHVLPQRHFEHSPILHLCEPCHKDLERLIPFELQPTPFYFAIVKLFLSSPC